MVFNGIRDYDCLRYILLLDGTREVEVPIGNKVEVMQLPQSSNHHNVQCVKAQHNIIFISSCCVIHHSAGGKVPFLTRDTSAVNSSRTRECPMP